MRSPDSLRLMDKSRTLKTSYLSSIKKENVKAVSKYFNRSMKVRKDALVTPVSKIKNRS